MPGDVVSEPLRRLRADARQLRELVDEPREWTRECLGQPASEPWELEAAGHAAELLSRELLRLPERVVQRREDEVLQRLDVFGIHRVLADTDLARLLRAGHDDGDRPAAGRALDRQRPELGLSLLHVGLHLARHALQVTDVLHLTRPPGCGPAYGTSRARRGASGPRSRAGCSRPRPPAASRTARASPHRRARRDRVRAPAAGGPTSGERTRR